METMITGATGFAGRALAAALRARGDGVRALVRKTSAKEAREALATSGAEVFEGDVRDEASIARAAKGAEVLFHCARLADPRAPRGDHEAVNLVGTENALSAARAAGVRRVVFLSTADVTQGTEARNYVDEALPQVAEFFDTWSETRALAEDLAVAANGPGLETVVLRAGWLWGPGDPCLLPRLVRRAKAGGFRWVDGGRSLVATTYVDNLVEGMLRAAVAPDAGGRVYYLTDDERVSAREFLTRLAGAAGVKLPSWSLPFGLAFALAWVGDRVSPPSWRRAEVASMGRSAHFNVQRARKELGYAPVVDVAEGMRRVKVSREASAVSSGGGSSGGGSSGA